MLRRSVWMDGMAAGVSYGLDDGGGKMRFGCLFQKKTITKSFTFLPCCYPVFFYSRLSCAVCTTTIHTVPHIYRRMDGWLDEWLVGWMDGWKVGRIYSSADVYGMYTVYIYYYTVDVIPFHLWDVVPLP